LTTIIATCLFAVPAASAGSSGAAVGYTAVSGAATITGEPERAAPENHSVDVVLVRELRAGVKERRGAAWGWQDRLGLPRTPTAYRERETHSRPYLRWLKRTWAKRAHKGWKRWESGLYLRDFQMGPSRNAWQRAVREVQRPYPGTESWLLSCSASEGGWGRWVPNSQGSGVGGWLQFMPGTWSGFYRHAVSDVTRRGFKVPGSSASWYSPLGQALAGAWGVTHGMRHHWVGAGC
jgi:hypothetical protein